jgi:hypothetical protein
MMEPKAVKGKEEKREGHQKKEKGTEKSTENIERWIWGGGRNSH